MMRPMRSSNPGQAGLFPPVELRPAREVYTVSRLNREARAVVERGFPALWIEGEISNLSRPGSGHLYFSLKDEDAQVRCAMFRLSAQRMRFVPRDGMKVLARARVTLYEARGEFQLQVEHLEEAGEGALRRAFEVLKTRLAAEGLFDQAKKRSLPALPRRIGLLTSAAGAAVRDVLHVLERRFPAIPVLLYPIPVQGADAAPRIAHMLRLASRRADCDVLILTRGGGSLEDLWAFNEEIVARAIRACAIPVVSAVGHEIDVTIADFAADLRAPTPSAAAELVVPDAQAWLRQLNALSGQLRRQGRRVIARSRERCRWLTGRLTQQHPRAQLRERTQRLDELALRLGSAQTRLVERLRTRYERSALRLASASPATRLARLLETCTHCSRRLRERMQRRLDRERAALVAAARALQAISPLATLARGYAIVSDTDGNVLRDAAQVNDGDRISARLASGRLIAVVQAREDEKR
jgi:exodeoxyribonuclease VII large subunit